MAKYIKKKALKKAIDNCTWYHINKNGELVEGANSSEHEPLYKYSDIKKIIKGLPTRKFKDEPQTCDDCIWNVCNYNKAFEDEPQTMYYPQVDGITPSVIEPQFDKDMNVRSKYKQGTWLYGDGVYCSCCGYKLETTALLAKCPKCGADMSKTDCPWK